MRSECMHPVCNLLMILAVVCYSDEVQMLLQQPCARRIGERQRTQRHRIAASGLPKTTTTTLSPLLFRRPRTSPSFHSIHKDWLTPSNSKCCAPVPISTLRILQELNIQDYKIIHLHLNFACSFVQVSQGLLFLGEEKQHVLLLAID